MGELQQESRKAAVASQTKGEAASQGENALPPVPDAIRRRYSSEQPKVPPDFSGLSRGGKVEFSLPVIRQEKPSEIREELRKRLGKDEVGRDAFARLEQEFRGKSPELQDAVLRHIAAVTRILEGKKICGEKRIAKFALQELAMESARSGGVLEHLRRETRTSTPADYEPAFAASRSILQEELQKEGRTTIFATHTHLSQLCVYRLAGSPYLSRSRVAGALNQDIVQLVSGKHVVGEGVYRALSEAAEEVQRRLEAGKVAPEKAAARYLELREPILQALGRMDKLQSGLGNSLLLAACQRNRERFSGFEKQRNLLELYALELAKNGEPAIGEALGAFDYYGVKPSAESIRNAVLLHAFTGFSRTSRLNYLGEPDGEHQKNYDGRLKEIAAALTAKPHQESPVAVVVMSGANDNLVFDALSFNVGRSLANFRSQGYRIVPFEVHNDFEVPAAVERAGKVLGRKPDVVVIAGHGMTSNKGKEPIADGSGINLGLPQWRSEYDKVNPAALADVERELAGTPLGKEAAALHQSVEQALAAKGQTPWRDCSLANRAEMTRDDAALDLTDAEHWQKIGAGMAEDGILLFHSCGAGNVHYGVSVAQLAAEASKKLTYACEKSITDTEVQFSKDHRVAKVIFYEGEGRERAVAPTITLKPPVR